MHHRLGLSERCAAFDINLGCTSFPYTLSVGHSMITAGIARHALLRSIPRCADHGDSSFTIADWCRYMAMGLLLLCWRLHLAMLRSLASCLVQMDRAFSI